MRIYFSQFILHSSLFALNTLAASIAMANDQNNLSAKEDVITLQSVVVTGSRRAVKSSLDAPAPVDIISPQQLQQTGESDLAKALSKLSASATLPSTPAGSFSSSVAPGIALRGLSTDQTLILINGKRRHTSAYFTRQSFAGGRGSASTDLSLIPISAVERVEILRDGAAAQYGSDAIAGVVNIILKAKSTGGGIAYQYGGYTQGDGDQQKILGWKSFALTNDGSVTVAFDAGKRDAANNTLPDSRKFYNSSSSTSAQYNDQNTPYRTWRFGSPEIKDQVNLSYNADLPLADDTSLYSFGTYGHRKTIGEGFYEPSSATAAVNQSIYYKERYPDGRIPLSIVTVDDFALTAGAKKGDQKTGKLDGFVTYGRNKVHTDQDNGINPSYGSGSPSSYSLGDNIFSQLNTGLDYSLDVNTSWFYHPITVSTGILYRWEQYQQVAGDPVAYTRGPYYNVTTAPEIYSGITDADQRKIDRNVYGAYLDLETDIVKDLNVGVALRSEKYSDFGNTTNGKLTLKYDFDPKLSLRGSASTGYRAPSLAQLGYSTYSVQSVETFTGSGVYHDVQQRTLAAGSEAAKLLGGSDLKPEKSTNYSVGFVWKPYDETSLTLDVYQIDIKNRILLSDNLTGSIVTNAFAGTAYSNINNAAFFNNLLDTRTRGAELNFKHNLHFNEYGNLALNLGFAANKNEITQARDSMTSTGQVISSSLIAGRNTASLIESAAPTSKTTLSALWSNDVWSVNTVVRRYGKWKILSSSSPSLDQTFGEQWIADLDIGYKADHWVKGLKFNVGANNLFNSHPDQTISSQPYGVVKYSFNSPEGSYGTYLYSRVSYDF
ncbi:iron complex outermembrane receptor protein [Acinetobacter baylyi]|uniref:Iron complex outermembrane receptor protein n=1 Tax=Acinetobacter baylyi TaxID=202950 RepID=A0ABU0UT96_ACIBI|nr:TonB-dependent receptor [Acinetobacter baylyi]MDQ1207772.1 iron complex outermembrane receptor protein [Acinetobacter baylyi]MDR6184640.1 iron complex outermembrane receptor protein [Acinetobacter baylyi]